MKSKSGFAIAMALSLAACGKGGGSEPTGQVVATVDGAEITVADIQAELADGNGGGGEAAKGDALQRIVARKLLAAEARRRDLDSTPLGAVLKARAEDEALAQVLSRSVLDKVPAVSDDEVSEFLRTYPATITQRRILNIDAILIPDLPKDLLPQLRPLKSLEDVQAVLANRRVKFQKTASTVDTLTVDPSFAAQLVETEGNDIFIIPNGTAIEVGRITTSRIEPLAGADATTAARAIITRKRQSDIVNSSLGKIVSDGQKSVKINPSYQGKSANPVGPN